MNFQACEQEEQKLQRVEEKMQVQKKSLHVCLMLVQFRLSLVHVRLQLVHVQDLIVCVLFFVCFDDLFFEFDVLFVSFCDVVFWHVISLAFETFVKPLFLFMQFEFHVPTMHLDLLLLLQHHESKQLVPKCETHVVLKAFHLRETVLQSFLCKSLMCVDASKV